MMISEIIKEIRRNVNITQDEMAQALYVTRQAVSRWENGDTTPNLETLKQISKIIGIDKVVARVIWRINIDHLDLAVISGLQQLKHF